MNIFYMINKLLYNYSNFILNFEKLNLKYLRFQISTISTEEQIELLVIDYQFLLNLTLTANIIYYGFIVLI
jgi:hypothetical protein